MAAIAVVGEVVDLWISWERRTGAEARMAREAVLAVCHRVPRLLVLVQAAGDPRGRPGDCEPCQQV